MSSYTVKQGDSIGDVVLNSTGSILNWDAILQANGFTDWTPDLIAGQVLTIPDTALIDSNTKLQLATYPAVNNLTDGVKAQMAEVFNTIYGYWILTTGFWNDNALWRDQFYWVD